MSIANTLVDLEQLRKFATPGTWSYWPYPPGSGILAQQWWIQNDRGADVAMIVKHGTHADAALITAAVNAIEPLVAEIFLLRKMVGYGIAHGHVCSIFKPPGPCDCGLVDLLRPDRKLGER